MGEDGDPRAITADELVAERGMEPARYIRPAAADYTCPTA